MKTLQIIACSLLVSTISALHAAPAPELQQLLTEGQTAYLRGELDKAKSAFEMAYQIDSHNTVAIGYLKRIKIDEDNRPKGNETEKKLSAIIIPQIQFKDATLGSAIEYLKKAVDRQTNGKLAVNIVPQLPTEQLNTQTVTLSLTNVPFTEALRYLGSVTNLTVVYDRYAIVLKPLVGPAPATASSTGQ